MMKKYRLVNRKRFYSIVFLALVVILLTGLAVGAAAGNARAENRMVTVMPGDTLWEIASENSTNMDIRKYIYEIKKMNGLEDATIYVGQELLLP